MIVFLVTCLAAFLCPMVYSEDTTVEWCYEKPTCNSTTWPKIASQFCNGSRQSPIDILTADVQANPNLTSFRFTGFGNNATLSVTNSGHTVSVKLDDDVMQVEGGDLPGVYYTKEFHLHWGNGSSGPGSDHTVDGKQYPLELHIVNVNSKYNRSIDEAMKANDPNGLAVLGFFIEATNDTSKATSWDILTSYLSNITKAGQTVNITNQITLDGLLEGVDRTKYYRYQGSLTLPRCNEIVIWTVFKDPIKVSHEWINRFSSTVLFNASSTFIHNNFRGVQAKNGRVVTSQVAGTSSAASIQSFSVITVFFYSILSWL